MQKRLPRKLSEIREFMRGEGKWFSKTSRSVSGISNLKTFAGMQKEEMHHELSSFVNNPEDIDALEIGPGFHPISELLPFRSLTLLEPPMRERDRVMLQNALKNRLEIRSKAMRLLFGRVERPPLKEHFGICVISEVLTHVLPKYRAQAIEKLAKLSDRLMILDRHDSTHPNANRRWLVDHKELEAGLQKMGFATKIQFFKPHWTLDQYFLLKATRIPLKAH